MLRLLDGVALGQVVLGALVVRDLRADVGLQRVEVGADDGRRVRDDEVGRPPLLDDLGDDLLGPFFSDIT